MTTDRISQVMDLIIKVRSGVMTAAAAAQSMGISRKTYYKWEARALRGMQAGLANREVGRPAQAVDPEKEALRKELEALRVERVIWDQIQQVRRELGLVPGGPLKKKDQLTVLLEGIDQVRLIRECSYRDASAELAVPAGSAKRWRARQQNGEALCKAPGPKKVEPLDMAEVRKAVKDLDHGRRRTAGTGRLYLQYSNGISRREMAALVKSARREMRKEKRAMERRIEWRAPGLIWAIDDTEICVNGTKMYVNRIRDLSTRFVVGTWTDTQLISGPVLALWLERLFERHGTPLVLKRDNGSNLNHEDVNRVLADHMVIALNSPPYYPPYNGGIENSQGEFKEALEPRLPGMPCNAREVQMSAELADHDLNHRPRPVLNNLSACLLYELGNPLGSDYNRRQRREAFEEIEATTVEVLRSMKRHGEREQATAWRRSVERWLQSHGLITVYDPQQVLPGLNEIWAHN